MREHLASLDLEALAELHVGLGNDLLELGLALKQRQLPEVLAVEVEQVESDQHDPGRAALELILKDREVSGAVRGGYHDLAVDDGGARLMCQAPFATFRKRLVQSLPRRVKTFTSSLARWTWTR